MVAVQHDEAAHEGLEDCPEIHWSATLRGPSPKQQDTAVAVDAGSDDDVGDQQQLLHGHSRLPRDERSVVPLYLTHFLSTFGDRMWQFAVPMLFQDLWTQSLLRPAVFAFGVCLACFLAMPLIGKYVDRTPRREAMRVFICAEAIAIVVSAAFFLVLLGCQHTEGDQVLMDDSLAVDVFLLLLLLSAAVAELTARGGTMALEKDWVVVIADGDAEYQTHLNTRMRTIDLTCKFLGPLTFGVLRSGFNQGTHYRVVFGVVVVALWNVFVVPAELWTMNRVYESFPALAEKEPPKAERTSHLANLRSGWSKYISHPIMLASVGYCLLYMTTLSDHDVLGSAFLVSVDVSELVLGLSRGVGAVMGLTGTMLFPMVLKRAGSLERAGAASVWTFFGVLFPIGVAFMISARSARYVMVVCVVLSRAALWSFDLSIQQIMQERIAAADRGAVNGVHSAMTQVFLMTIDVCAMLFKRPEQFWVLVSVSLTAVATGALLFTHWARRDGSL
eukprot:TRINITY_DN43806_c0_g1_i1.p1 TRINITY_DN43806_c0_g1~~TRINITY_DN43806_c0_g1_i1.p1  ORF type:complete len:502 (+),score=148.66 TRINITY_DN43806_c0_g1_i1:106-1611(+)